MKKVELLKERLLFLINSGASAEEIRSVEEQIYKSNKGRKSKRKGASFERDLIKIFKKEFPTLTLARTPMSGGFYKKATKESLRGDISCLDEKVDFLLHIEAKNQKTLHVKDWWKQAVEDCPEHKIPTLVIHIGQEIEQGKVIQKSGNFIYLRLDDFLKIVDKEKIILDKN